MSDVVGLWEEGGAPDVVAVHMALLRTGKVLLYTGNEANTFAHINEGKCKVWEPATKTDIDSPILRNLFCSGHCFLPDGRLLVCGGQSPAQEFITAIRWLLFQERAADHDMHLFDPETDTWTRLSDMPRARWYPTLTTLPDGRILIVSGFAAHVLDSISRLLGLNFSALNETYEIFDPTTTSVTARGDFWPGITLYPFVHVLPGGHLFVHSVETTRLYESATMAQLPHEFAMPGPGTFDLPRHGVVLVTADQRRWHWPDPAADGWRQHRP